MVSDGRADWATILKPTARCARRRRSASRCGCGNCAKTPGRVSAPRDFRPRTTKTGDSRTLRRWRGLRSAARRRAMRRFRRRRLKPSRGGRGLPAGLRQRTFCAGAVRDARTCPRAWRCARWRRRSIAATRTRLRSGGHRAASGPLCRRSPRCVCGAEHGTVGRRRVPAHPARCGDRASDAPAVCFGGRRQRDHDASAHADCCGRGKPGRGDRRLRFDRRRSRILERGDGAGGRRRMPWSRIS